MHITAVFIIFLMEQYSSINIIPTTSTSRIRKLVLLRFNNNDRKAIFLKFQIATLHPPR